MTPELYLSTLLEVENPIAPLRKSTTESSECQYRHAPPQMRYGVRKPSHSPTISGRVSSYDSRLQQIDSVDFRLAVNLRSEMITPLLYHQRSCRNFGA